MPAADFDTVILAGGQAARMRGADKPALDVDGKPMLVRVAEAAASAESRRLVIVGPERSGAIESALAEIAANLPGGLITVRESPPGGGPVPALRRGMAEVDAPWLALLAADMPFLTGQWLTELLRLAVLGGTGEPGGALLSDDGGRRQWLAGCWNSSRLRSSLAGYTGQSLRGLLGPLNPVVLAPAQDRWGDGRPAWLDCDDPAGLAMARAAHQDGAT